MESRSAWFAFEGRVIRQVLPLVLSFVCFVSSILLALSLPLHRLSDHLLDWEGPEGRLESIQRVLSHVHWPMSGLRRYSARSRSCFTRCWPCWYLGR